jgi:hypothetical protein
MRSYEKRHGSHAMKHTDYFESRLLEREIRLEWCQYVVDHALDHWTTKCRKMDESATGDLFRRQENFSEWSCSKMVKPSTTLFGTPHSGAG